MSSEQDRASNLRGAPALLAIIRAARAIGDRDLEQAAKRQLRDGYGIEVTCRRPQREAANA